MCIEIIYAANLNLSALTSKFLSVTFSLQTVLCT